MLSVKQLWKDLNVENNLIEIFAEGFTHGKTWCLGFEFAYANPESINCRLMPGSDELYQFLLKRILSHRGIASVKWIDKLQIGSIRAHC